MARRSISKPLPLLAAVGLLAFLIASPTARAAEYELKVTVAHAKRSGSEIHPSLMEIAKSLRQLFDDRGIDFELKSLLLKDEGVFKLSVGSSGRMQLPNGKWMTLKVESHEAGKGMLKIAIAVEKLDFKTKVGIAAGATAVLPGPNHQDGQFILVITRLPATAR